MRSTLSASLILGMLSTAACHTMRPVALEQLGAIRPGQVWVTRTDQTVVLVSGPQIVNNRLVGFVNGEYQVMPAADVKQVLMRRPATARTATLVAAGAAGAAALVALLSSNGRYNDPCSVASSECEP